MTNNQSAIQRLLESPAFYAIGMIVGLLGWAFRYLEDGHLILILGAGTVGLVRYFRTRPRPGDSARGGSD